MTTPPLPASPYANVHLSGHVIAAQTVTVAAAAVRVPDSSRLATAWVADCGQYGSEAVPTPSRVTGRNDLLIGGLRAVSKAVQALRRDHLDEDMVLLCGNPEAAGFLRLWLDGNPVCPDGYVLERSGGRPSSLEWLLAECGEYPESYRVEDTPAGSGLEGAAWKLAGLTARAVRRDISMDGLKSEAAAVVEAALGVQVLPAGAAPGGEAQQEPCDGTEGHEHGYQGASYGSQGGRRGGYQRGE